MLETKQFPEKFMLAALQEVKEERYRQNRRFPDDRNLSHEQWLRILVEEVGEVADSMSSHGRHEITDELIQVAAVAVAWWEDIQRDA